MHFHAPAEHTFDYGRKQYDLELHIVHRRYNMLDNNVVEPRIQSADGSVNNNDHNKLLTVLAIFFDIEHGGNQKNEFIEALNLQNLKNVTSGNSTTRET